MDIPQLNLSGLTALAGNALPNLNLKRTGFDPDQVLSLFVQNKLAQQRMEQDAAELGQNLLLQREREKGLNERSLFLANSQAQQQDLNRQNQLDQINLRHGLNQQISPYQQAQLGIDQQRLGIDQQKLGLDQQQNQNQAIYQQAQIKNQEEDNMIKMYQTELEKMFKMDDKERESKSSNAMGYLMGMQMLQNDPQKMEEFSQNWTKNAVANKLMSEEDAKNFNSMDPIMRMSTQTQGLTMNGAIAFMKGTQSQNKNGTNIEFNSDGSLKSLSVNPTKPTQNELQKRTINDLDQLNQLENIAKEYQDKFLTYKGKATDFVGNIQSKLGMSDTEYTKFSQQNAGFKSNMINSTFKMMKNLSGVQYSDTQLAEMRKSLVNDSDSPAQFQGKFKALLDQIKSDVSVAQEVQASGIPLGTSEFKQKFEERKQSMLNNVSNSLTLPTFNSREEFQQWYKSQSPDVQEQVRKQLPQ